MSTRATILMALLAAICCSSAMATELESNHSALAQFMLESLPAKSGLCVHLGVEDGDLDVALSDGGRFLVHGLGTEQDGIERARKHIAAARLQGAVSVELGSFNPLPYADNIVSLLVVDDLPSLLKQGLKLEEVTRVLSPHGTAWLGQLSDGDGTLLSSAGLKEILINAGLKDCKIIERHGIWATYIKPRPAGMDVWTHQGYDASGNPASTDQMGMPNGVRWIVGPNWPRGYRKSGTSTRVVSEKHLAYIFRDTVLPGVPEQWTLYVRDAYNGLLLWKRELDSKWSTLVSAGDRFILRVGGGDIIAVNADTGRIVHTYQNTKGCRSVSYIDGTLIVHVPEGLRCLDAAGGKMVWSKANAPGSELRGFKAANGKVFLHLRTRGQDGQTLHIFKCLDLKTGKELWKNNTASWCKGNPSFLFYQYDVLVARTGTTLHGISAINGSHLWSLPVPCKYNTVRTLAAAGLIWVQNDMTVGGPGWEGWDPQTGKTVKRVAKWTERVPYHWGRCCGNYATPNFIICGGFDFADLQTGEIKLFNAVKNGCTTAGVVPANGMAYTFPNACWCRNWLRGFLACAATRTPDVGATTHQAGRLQKGPAYGASTIAPGQATPDWRTYRHDTGRSAATAAAGPKRLDMLWTKQVTSAVPASLADQWDVKDDGGRLTAPVAAGDLVFVTASDQHSLIACDAKTGAPRWTFVAGGRIDCPPTLYAGLCLFGSRDGWVYCLAAKDGSVVWRYRAAPQESRIVAYGQLESVWPVVGGVLVYDGLAYFTAGRHSDIDGGVVIGAVEPRTGKLVWMRKAEGLGGVPDVLIGGDGAIAMGSLAFDAKDGRKIDTRARFRASRLGLRNDAWNRNPIALRKGSNVWMVDKEKTGQMLSFNKSVTVGFRTGAAKGNDNLARSFTGNARLFAIPEKNETAKADHLRKEWFIDMHAETRVRGMVLTPERLYVAGRLYHTLPVQNPASYDMGSGNFTLSVRFLIPGEGGASGAHLVSKAPPSGGSSTGIKQIFFKDRRVHYAIDGLGTLTSKSEVANDKWHHVVVTDHSGEVRLYVDGKLEGTKRQFTQSDLKGHVIQLRERRGGWPMDLRCEMSEVRYYSGSLDDTAAKALSLDKDPGGAAPALLWKPAPDQPKSVEELPNVVRIYSVSDGQILGEYPVKEEFIHDCLAVVGDRLYVSTEKGLICLGEK